MFGGFMQTGGVQIVDGDLEVMGAAFDLAWVGALIGFLARASRLAALVIVFRTAAVELGSQFFDLPHQHAGFVVLTCLLEFGGFAFKFGSLGAQGGGADRLCGCGGDARGDQHRAEQERGENRGIHGVPFDG